VTGRCRTDKQRDLGQHTVAAWSPKIFELQRSQGNGPPSTTDSGLWASLASSQENSLVRLRCSLLAGPIKMASLHRLCLEATETAALRSFPLELLRQTGVKALRGQGLGGWHCLPPRESRPRSSRNRRSARSCKPPARQPAGCGPFRGEPKRLGRYRSPERAGERRFVVSGLEQATHRPEKAAAANSREANAGNWFWPPGCAVAITAARVVVTDAATRAMRLGEQTGSRCGLQQRSIAFGQQQRGP